MHSSFAGPLPVGLDLVHLLTTRIPTLSRVPIAASSTCARSLNFLLQAVEREQTWETLTRLPLFPPTHRPCGTHTGRQGNEVFLGTAMPPQLPCVRYRPPGGHGCPHQPAGGGGWPPNTGLTQDRGVGGSQRLAPGLGRMVAALRALLAGGVPGRPIQILTSDNICEAGDPAALAHLRQLHPQADGPSLEAPHPEDRTGLMQS